VVEARWRRRRRYGKMRGDESREALSASMVVLTRLCTPLGSWPTWTTPSYTIVRRRRCHI
jgi:hypothetical protein